MQCERLFVTYLPICDVLAMYVLRTGISTHSLAPLRPESTSLAKRRCCQNLLTEEQVRASAAAIIFWALYFADCAISPGAMSILDAVQEASRSVFLGPPPWEFRTPSEQQVVSPLGLG